MNILMPALSPTMEVGTLSKWLIKEGDPIKSGQVIAEIETDKATMDFEAIQEGIVDRILISEGTEGIPVNTPLAVLIGRSHDPDYGLVGSQEWKVASEVTHGSPAAVTKLESSDRISDREIPAGTEFRTQTVREALRDALVEEMRRDDDVFLMGEEVARYQGAYRISQGLLEEFGVRRVIDTPITAHGFTGLAVGAAFAGLRPIVEFTTFNFALQALDQIINSAAKTRYMSGGRMSASIVFRGPNGASARVGAQHSHDFAALYSHIPGLKVIQPYSAADAKGLLKSAIRDPDPVVFLENEILYGQSFQVPDLDDFTVAIGKARVARAGEDVTIVSYGIGMTFALQAADQLGRDGISVEVIDLRSLRPMDTETVIRSVKKTNRCVTVEEGWPVGSIGDHVSATLMSEAFDYLDAPVLNCTGKDVPMPYAANLEMLARVTTPEVIDACRAVVYR